MLGFYTQLMWKTHRAKQPILQSAFLLTAVLMLAAETQAQWVAYNDHSPGILGSQTHANATTNYMRLAGGPYALKDITTGAELPNVTMTVTVTGATPVNGGIGGTPDAGTPLSSIFDGYAYFGANVIQIRTSTVVTVTFSGLDPSRRYRFQGGACRGGSYTDRWTKFDIAGADTVTPNHQQGSTSPYGIITADNEPAFMSGYEIAINTGHNRAGDMVQWDNINPGADGSFQVTSTQWYSATPCPSHGITGGTFTPTSAYSSYALDAFRLEEYFCDQCVSGVTLWPGDQTAKQCSTVSWVPSVIGLIPPYSFQWFKNELGTPIDSATNATLTLSNIQATDAGSYFVLVSDYNLAMLMSDPVTLTVTNDTTPPALLSAVGGPDLYTITVSFSKPILLSGPEAIRVLNYSGVGGLPVVSATVTNETNVVLITSAPRQGAEYWAEVQTNGVADACQGTLVSAGTRVRITERLVLVGFNINNTWFYNQDGIELGTEWKENSYPAETTWASGQAAFEGRAVPRTNLSTVPIRTSLLLTNPASPFARDLPTYYFRTHFLWPASGCLAPELTLRTLVDDGMIVYLNGLEVWRTTNIVATNEAFADYLLMGSVGDAAISPPITLDPSRVADALRSGDNALAVYLKQHNQSSSDITFALELTATITNFNTPDQVVVDIAPATLNTTQCSSFTLTANVSDPYSFYAYQWFKDTNALHDNPRISGSTTAILRVSDATTNDSGNYHVRISNFCHDTYASAPVPVSVLTNGAVPVMLSALGLPDLHTIVVTFNQPVSISSPSGDDFQVPSMWHWSDLILTNSYVTNGTNVILKSSNERQMNNYTVTVQGIGVVGLCAGLSARPGSMVDVLPEFRLLGLDTNTTWQYNHAGIDLGSVWLMNNFDDHDSAAGWATGFGLFDGKAPQPPGRSTVNGQRVCTQLQLTNALFPGPASVIPSYYFRTRISLNGLFPTGLALRGRTFFDDGAIIYLNGQEAWRSTNVVATNQAFYGYLQQGLVSNANFNAISLPVTNWSYPNNVVAVYLKQGTPINPDITMGLELTLTVTNFIEIPPYRRLSIERHADDATVVTISWVPAGGRLWETSDLNTAWVLSPNQSNGTRRPIAGSTRFYKVTMP